MPARVHGRGRRLPGRGLGRVARPRRHRRRSCSPGASDEEELADALRRGRRADRCSTTSRSSARPRFARAPAASASSAPGSATTTSTCDAADPARRDRLQRPRLRDRGGGRPRDHVPAGPGPPADPLPRGDPRGGLGLPDGARHASAAGQDARPRRLRPDRHGDRAPGQGVRPRRRLLRPARPAGDRQGPRHPPGPPTSKNCSSRATSSACTATSTRRPTT